MALIDHFLHRAIKRGQLTLTKPDGSTSTFGTPDSDLAPVSFTIHDRGVYRAIVADPALGVAEAFMDGRLTIEQGDILDLLMLATGNSRWENGVNRLAASPCRRSSSRWRSAGQRKPASRTRCAFN